MQIPALISGQNTHTHTSNGHRNAMNNTSPQLTPHNAHKDEYTTILLPTGTK